MEIPKPSIEKIFFYYDALTIAEQLKLFTSTKSGSKLSNYLHHKIA